MITETMHPGAEYVLNSMTDWLLSADGDMLPSRPLYIRGYCRGTINTSAALIHRDGARQINAFADLLIEAFCE